MKRNQKKTKTILYAHTKRRMIQRYGMDISFDDYLDMCNIALARRSGTAMFLYQTSRNRSLWEIFYKNTKIIIVLDHKRKAIATVLTKKQYITNMVNKKIKVLKKAADKYFERK